MVSAGSGLSLVFLRAPATLLLLFTDEFLDEPPFASFANHLMCACVVAAIEQNDSVFYQLNTFVVSYHWIAPGRRNVAICRFIDSALSRIKVIIRDGDESGIYAALVSIHTHAEETVNWCNTIQSISENDVEFNNLQCEGN